MKTLTLFNANSQNALTFPMNSDDLDLNSSALKILHDFKHEVPLTVDRSIPATDALALMVRAGAKHLLATDSNGQFLGVVVIEHLNNQEIIKKISEGYQRNDLTVSDFMIPKAALQAFSYQELETATVSDVLRTLNAADQNLCLVVDQNKPAVRGLISAKDIAKQLNLAQLQRKSTSFQDIARVIKGHMEHHKSQATRSKLIAHL